MFCTFVDVGVQETLEQLGVEFDSKPDESDASNATRIISCVGLRVISFAWSGGWTFTKPEQQQSLDCMNSQLMLLAQPI